MKNKKLTISSLTASLLLGLAVTSFAGMGILGNSTNIGTEAGIDIVASPKALAAAANYDYSSRDMVAMGTEAGADIVASEKAKIAAVNFDYNAKQLALVGTEAGYDPTEMSTGRDFFNTGTTSEQVAGQCLKDNAQVSTC